jgi:nicotinamidase-related amidase
MASDDIRDVLLVVDVVDTFHHEDGDLLLASFRSRLEPMRGALRTARDNAVPVVYANDNSGVWDGDRNRLIRDALEQGLGPDAVAALQPRDGDRFLVKPRYSAFDLTPLALILQELEARRLVVIGATTEMCVTQTAIDARERGYLVTVLADACAAIDAELEQVALAYLEAVTGTFVVPARAWRPGVAEHREPSSSRIYGRHALS